MKKVIVVSGPPGVGSTTIAKELAKKLKFRVFTLGFLQKGLAKEKNKNQSRAALKVWKTKLGRSKSLHYSLDKLQIEEARKGNVVICSKLGIHFLKNVATFTIWLEADLLTRAKRSAKRDKIPLKEAKKTISERENIEREEWKKIYGFDYFKQREEADLVLDTSNLTVKETVDKILKFMGRGK